MSEKIFRVVYRKEFECVVRAEDEHEAMAEAVAAGDWRVAAQTGLLWNEFLEVQEME